MIYDKPRNISFRVFPSASLSKPKSKVKVNKVPIDANEPIIDVSTMPIIDGVPMLRFSDDPKPDIIIPQKRELPLEVIDVSLLPDIDGVPMLVLPDQPVAKDEEAQTPAPIAEPPRAKREDKIKAPKKARDKAPGRKTHLIKAASFLVMLYVGAIIAFSIPMRPDYSASEKRNLAQFPEFNKEALYSGDYFNDINTWFSDTFPFRDFLTQTGTKIKNLYGFNSINIHGDVEKGDDIPDGPLEIPSTEPGAEAETTEPTEPRDEETDVQTQSLGAIIVAGDAGYEYYTYSKDLAPRFINSVSNIKSSVNGNPDVYALVVPTSIDITLNDNLRDQIGSADQKKALEFFNSSFRDVTAVDGIFKAERMHRKEYTYFRTDHHWTALGAYYAYEQYCIEKGIKPIPLSKYETVTYDNFLGTFYSGSKQTSLMAENPDYVTAYQPFNDVNCHIVEADGDEFDWKVVADVTNYDRGSKYLTFIGGDNAITTITNNDNPNGETCVVIKESYGNAFVPFLIPHYSTVYVIDPRHYKGTLSEFTSDKEIDDVVFIANISTTRNYIYIDAMERLIK